MMYEGTRTVFKAKCIRHKFSVLFYLFLICYYGYTISRAYGFTFFPDEFGYWSYAAKTAGYDWSDITALGSYYSYGYSLILFPIFIIFHNAVTAYRVAVTLNFILLGAAYWLLLRIQNQLFPWENGERKELFAAIAMLYPAWLFYARSTMVESVLVFCFLLSCRLLQKYSASLQKRCLAGFVICLVYQYFLHMRTLGALIAGVLALLTVLLTQSHREKRNKKIIYTVVTLAILTVMLAGGYVIKKAIGDSLYGADTENYNINNFAGQISKIKYFFSKEGLWAAVCSLSGKLVYTEIASFGLVWLGFWNIVKAIHRKSENSALWIYTGLSLLAEIAISAIFLVNTTRVDDVFYGRYHEFIFPLLMVMGLWEIVLGKKNWLKLLILIGINYPLMWMAVTWVAQKGITNIHGYFMVGMSFLHEMGDFSVTEMLWLTYPAHVIAAFLVMGIVAFLRKSANWNFLLTGIWILEIVLALRASAIYLDASARGAFRDTFIADKIEELREEEPQSRILYINDNEYSLISIMQFMLRDEDIEILPYKSTIEEYSSKEMTETDIVLLDYRSSYGTELEKKYDCNVVNGHFILYYNK